MNQKARSYLPPAVLVVGLFLAVLCYLPSLSGGFLFDDLPHVVNNPSIQIQDFGFQSLWRAARSGPLRTRPLSYVSFALDYYRAGLEPRVFHLTNLVLHLMTTLAAWLLLRSLYRVPPFSDRVADPALAAALGATVFALHPVQVQGVAYIVQRMNLLAGLFTLAAMLLWVTRLRAVSGRARMAASIGVILAALAGLAGKETAFALVLLVPALDRCRFSGGAKEWLKARWRLLVLAGLMGTAVAAVYALANHGLFRGYQSRSFTWGERLLTQPRVVLWYVWAWLVPAGRLSLEHELAVSSGLFHPWTTLPAALVLVMLAVTAILRAQRAPLFWLGVLWFMAGLALESSILPLELVFEHRLYLPGLGLVMAATDLFYRTRPGRAAAPLLAVIVIALALGGWERNHVFGDPVRLWKDAARKAPASPRPWANLCAEGLAAGERGAEAWCRMAVKRDPGQDAAWYHLGLVLLDRGRFKAAEEALARAADLRPDWAETHFQLGRAQALEGRLLEAEKETLLAIELDATDPGYYYQLGLTRMTLGRPEEARSALTTALALAGGDELLTRAIQSALHQVSGRKDSGD